VFRTHGRGRDGDGFVAGRAFETVTGTGAVHGQFLFAIGAIEDNIHKRNGFLV
jgi:hypothetical protein